MIGRLILEDGRVATVTDDCRWDCGGDAILQEKLREFPLDGSPGYPGLAGLDQACNALGGRVELSDIVLKELADEGDEEVVY